MNLQDRSRSILSRFFGETEATVLLETLIAVPVITVLAVGTLEFGNIFWQRQQLQIAVRDAARYWARCRPTSDDFTPSCSANVARNIAFYGKPYPQPAIDGLRVPGWDDEEANLIIEPAVLPRDAQPTVIVRVVGTLNYLGSPMMRFAMPSAITVTYAHEERYIGW